MSDLVKPPAKKIDLTEFRDLGFLQEANRQWFHPRGLALEVVVDEDGNAVRLGGIWDYRDDPEGIAFEQGPDAKKAANVQAEFDRHWPSRLQMFANAIQPVGHPLLSPPKAP
jgi:hypothetical protein